MKKAFDITIVKVGTGITEYIGSDSYAYYVTEVLPNKVLGIYTADAHFDATHPWQGGVMVVEPFDETHKTTKYIKQLYGNWWIVSRDGKTRLQKFHNLQIGSAHAYRDPSF